LWCWCVVGGRDLGGGQGGGRGGRNVGDGLSGRVVCAACVGGEALRDIEASALDVTGMTFHQEARKGYVFHHLK